MSRRRKRRPRGRGRRFALVAASGLVAVGLVLVGVGGYRALAPQDPPQLAAAGEQGDTTWTGGSAKPANRSVPTHVSIPKIDVQSSLDELSRNDDGVLNAPETGDTAGWYHGSATPGARGAAVIAGHVDWTDGPAVFYELGELAPGDEVEVERADGRIATFSVHATRQYPKNSFPSKLVYGKTQGPELRLITCAGDFANGHYVDNIVVYAHLVDVA